MHTLNHKIVELTEAVYPALVPLRHQIHEHPELGYQEYKTSDLVAKTLKNWQIPIEKIPGTTAIIGYIKGQLSSDNSIAIRADMDALPLHETSGVSYASKTPGVMHACGHDVNTVNLLGTAYVLSNLTAHFGGTIKLIFQPAEEIFGGAQEIIDHGVLDNPTVSAILAAHVNARYPVGAVAVKSGTINMAASTFEVVLRGRGGHASAPYATEDIVSTAAKLILDLQSIPRRILNYIDPAVVAIATIHAGDRNNVIPSQLRFTGTVRGTEYKVHQMIENEMRKVLQAHELVTGVKGSLEFQFASQAIVNDPLLTQSFITAAEELVGKEQVIIVDKPTNGSENFALFSERVPSVYFRIGGTAKGETAAAFAHNANFKVEDASLKTGVMVMAKAAMQFIQET